MRKLVFILSAVAAVGFTVPLATTSAQAEKVVIKSGDRGHDRGWNRGHRKVVVIKRGHNEGWRRHHAEGSKKVIIKRD